MRLLLDTHVAIWALSRPKRIPPVLAAMLADEENSIFVSAAGIWELAIKASLNRAGNPDIDPARVVTFCEKAGYQILPVTTPHALAVTSLPHIHADPFDRIMIAQAKVEPMHLVTHDRTVAAYDESFISW